MHPTRTPLQAVGTTATAKRASKFATPTRPARLLDTLTAADARTVPSPAPDPARAAERAQPASTTCSSRLRQATTASVAWTAMASPFLRTCVWVPIPLSISPPTRHPAAGIHPQPNIYHCHTGALVARPLHTSHCTLPLRWPTLVCRGCPRALAYPEDPFPTVAKSKPTKRTSLRHPSPARRKRRVSSLYSSYDVELSLIGQSQLRRRVSSAE